MLELIPDFFLDGQKQNDNRHNMGEYDTTGGTYKFRNNTSRMGIKARHSFYGWKGRTEWQVNSNVSVTDRII